MSPARSRKPSRSGAASRREPLKLHRFERADIVKAVLVSAGIVIVTAILVWMLRPGPAGIPATGGLMNRQPRASWLIFSAIAAGSIACWMVMRGGPRTRKRAKVILPIALVIVLLATIGAGIAWPGGLLRHDVAPVTEPAPEVTTTTTPPTTPSTPSTQPTATTGTPSTTAGTAATGPPTTPAR
jgi:amino acid transporter